MTTPATPRAKKPKATATATATATPATPAAVPLVLPDTTAAAVPAVLMAYQQRWVADRSPLKVMEKSRRTGITWGEASDNVLTAASDRTAGGQNVYYIAYNQDMTIEYIQACAMWARVFNRAAGEIDEGFWDGESDADKAIKTYTIRFPSGFRIVALSSRPSNLRGRQGVIVIDEAAFHEQLGELLKAAMAMLIWGGQVHVISTHNGDTNPFNELVTDIRAGKRRGTVQRVDFGEAVAEGLYRRVCMRLGKPWTQAEEAEWKAGVYAFYGDGAAEELDCIPANGTGAWLSRALIESRMVPAPVLRFTGSVNFNNARPDLREREMQDWIDEHVKPLAKLVNPDLRHALGMDFGRSGDLSCIAPSEVASNLRVCIPFLVELKNVPYNQQLQVLYSVADMLTRMSGMVIDSRGNGSYIGEAAHDKYGSVVQRLMPTEGWYRDNMPPYKAAFEDDTLTVPKHDGLLQSHRAIKLVRGVPRMPEGKTEDGGHGDNAMACVYSHAATRLNLGPVQVASRPRRHSVTAGY